MHRLKTSNVRINAAPLAKSFDARVVTWQVPSISTNQSLGNALGSTFKPVDCDRAADDDSAPRVPSPRGRRRATLPCRRIRTMSNRACAKCHLPAVTFFRQGVELGPTHAMHIARSVYSTVSLSAVSMRCNAMRNLKTLQDSHGNCGYDFTFRRR